MSIEKAFDSAASDYDDAFTNATVGKLQRERVYYWLEKWRFHFKSRCILEINGGTGVDAQKLILKKHSVIYTDLSARMLEQAEKRVQNLEGYQKDGIEALDLYAEKGCNTVFSNFGGLNCFSEAALTSFVQKLGAVQKKKHTVVLVIMPKGCLMENLYFFFTFRWRLLFRRKHGPLEVAVGADKVKTYYYSPRQIRKLLLANGYKNITVKPVAFVIPPSYLSSKIGSRMGYFLLFLEQILGRFSLFSGSSDHFIIKAVKK